MAATKVTRDYLSALRSFWEGRPQTAIEHLSLALADQPERDDRFMMYRLWIEILADLNEIETLRSLSDHLHTLSLMNPHEADYYIALRGLIALETDQISAARLFAKGALHNKTNMYSEELRFRILQRVTNGRIKTSLTNHINHLEDYFHLQVVTQVAYQSHDTILKEKILKRSNKIFENAPLHLFFQTHTALDEGDFVQAAYCSKLLVDLYPSRIDYAVYAGYAMVCARKTKEAVSFLEKLVQHGAERDPDVTSLLSYAYAQEFSESNDKEYLQKTKYYEHKTRKNLEELGMGAWYNQDINLDVYAHSSEESMKPWLVKLNAAQFHDFRDSPKDRLDLISFALGKEARAGDLVFLAGDDYRDSDHWRLAAVYTVTTNPKVDPVNGYEVGMKLVCKPELAVPFDVKIKSGSKIQSGIIELDLDAIDLISDAIESYSEIDVSSGVILDEISKMRMSS